MTPIPDPDLTALTFGVAGRGGIAPDWAARTNRDEIAAQLSAAKREQLATPEGRERFIRERVGRWTDPAEPITPLAADPGDMGRCLVGCGHADDDPRCTGTWRMSDFGESPW